MLSNILKLYSFDDGELIYDYQLFDNVSTLTKVTDKKVDITFTYVSLLPHKNSVENRRDEIIMFVSVIIS